MKNILKIRNILILALLLLGWSCQEDYEEQLSSTYPISGDWTVRVNDGTSLSDPFFIKIYNTSFSTDSVWVDDNGEYWETKSKVKVNMNSLTFSGENTQNDYYDSQVSYANGKVIGKDSIYFEVKYSDDDHNLTYIFAGHRKQSYEEYNTH